MKKPKRFGTPANRSYLLDTVTLVWAVGSPERLSPHARRLVDDGENVVSVGSFWEVVIKTQKGLLSIADLSSWWRRVIDLTATRVLPIRASHVTALAVLPMLHKDPFDRILIAQSNSEGLPLVTNDAQIRQYTVSTIW